jgi:hypothetical protein
MFDSPKDVKIIFKEATFGKNSGGDGKSFDFNFFKVILFEIINP